MFAKSSHKPYIFGTDESLYTFGPEIFGGVDSSRLSVVPGSVKAGLDSIHFKVKSKGGQTWNCYFTTAVAISSDAVCKKVGSKGKDPVVRKQKKEADDCNALLRAAGRC